MRFWVAPVISRGLVGLAVASPLVAFANLPCPGVTPVLAAYARPLQDPHVLTCEQLSEDEAASCRRGKAQFSSRELSADGRVSCASCHVPVSGFRDGLARPRARGVFIKAPRTPSLVDVARTNGPFFWNGRATSLQGQIFWPLYATQELGATETLLARFGGAQAVASNLALFLQTLSTGPAPFDAYVAGHCGALAPAERRGLELVLLRKRCTQCHKGPEFRGEKAEPMNYFNIPDFAFLGQESSYSADAQLAEGQTFAEVGTAGYVTLGSVPQTLRNLHLRGPPWGRYGSKASLEDFLLSHGSQPQQSELRATWSRGEIADVLAFLFVGLRSEEKQYAPQNSVNEDLSLPSFESRVSAPPK